MKTGICDGSIKIKNGSMMYTSFNLLAAARTNKGSEQPNNSTYQRLKFVCPNVSNRTTKQRGISHILTRNCQLTYLYIQTRKMTFFSECVTKVNRLSLSIIFQFTKEEKYLFISLTYHSHCPSFHSIQFHYLSLRLTNAFLSIPPSIFIL